MFDKLLQNTRKPVGLGGRMILKGMNSGHAPLSEWGLSHLSPAADAQVLDVGCGGGANIAQLLKMCPHGFVRGIDYSPESVAYSKKTNGAELGRRCEIVQGDVGNMPFQKEAFHIVTAFETVYFWPDLSQAFAEIYRVLKPGGQFMLVCEMSDPSDTTWTDRIKGMTVYSAEDLQQRMKTAGFSEVTFTSGEKQNICLLAKK